MIKLCSNCKWLREDGMDENFPDLCHIRVEKTEYTHKRALKYYAQCAIKNRDNDCVDYKRKWWKFWVPEKQ